METHQSYFRSKMLALQSSSLQSIVNQTVKQRKQLQIIELKIEALVISDNLIGDKWQMHVNPQQIIIKSRRSKCQLLKGMLQKNQKRNLKQAKLQNKSQVSLGKEQDYHDKSQQKKGRVLLRTNTQKGQQHCQKNMTGKQFGIPSRYHTIEWQRNQLKKKLGKLYERTKTEMEEIIYFEKKMNQYKSIIENDYEVLKDMNVSFEGERTRLQFGDNFGRSKNLSEASLIQDLQHVEVRPRRMLSNPKMKIYQNKSSSLIRSLTERELREKGVQYLEHAKSYNKLRRVKGQSSSSSFLKNKAQHKMMTVE